MAPNAKSRKGGKRKGAGTKPPQVLAARSYQKYKALIPELATPEHLPNAHKAVAHRLEDNISEEMKKVVGEAMNTYIDVMRYPTTNASARIAAANAVMELATKPKEMHLKVSDADQHANLAFSAVKMLDGMKPQQVIEVITAPTPEGAANVMEPVLHREDEGGSDQGSGGAVQEAAAALPG